MTHSMIDNNGVEDICFCVSCRKDKFNGHCNGELLTFENDHKKQLCKIMIGTPSMGNWKLLGTIKDEVLTEKECISWMEENGYIEKCEYKERESNG